MCCGAEGGVEERNSCRAKRENLCIQAEFLWRKSGKTAVNTGNSWVQSGEIVVQRGKLWYAGERFVVRGGKTAV